MEDVLHLLGFARIGDLAKCVCLHEVGGHRGMRLERERYLHSLCRRILARIGGCGIADGVVISGNFLRIAIRGWAEAIPDGNAR